MGSPAIRNNDYQFLGHYFFLQEDQNNIFTFGSNNQCSLLERIWTITWTPFYLTSPELQFAHKSLAFNLKTNPQKQGHNAVTTEKAKQKYKIVNYVRIQVCTKSDLILKRTFINAHRFHLISIFTDTKPTENTRVSLGQKAYKLIDCSSV